jgi:anti-sigma factor RsiW
MSPSRPDWTEVSAYVDGELAPPEAAEVARALAGNRVLAGTAATLAKLKAAVHESVEVPDIDLPEAPIRRVPRGAIAACLVGVLALAAAALWIPLGGTDAPPPWLNKAWAAHEAWAKPTSTQATAREANAGQVLAAVSRLGVEAYLPDLTSAKLTLTWIEPTRLGSPDREAMHLGYRGTRGCRVSLFILAGGADLPSAFTQFGAPPRRSYSWSSATHGYLLMADGMDQARLDLIARSLHQATRERAPLDAPTRTALRQSRDKSIPCPS